MGASAASAASQEEKEETKEQGRRKEGMAEGGVKSGDPHLAGEDMFPYRNIQNRFFSFCRIAV